MAVIDEITDLSVLTRKQRLVVSKLREGNNLAHVAEEVGIDRETAQNHMYSAVKRFRESETRRSYVFDEPDETPAQAHDRIRADLIAGRRCGAPLGRGNCWLLTPCADHDR